MKSYLEIKIKEDTLAVHRATKDHLTSHRELKGGNEGKGMGIRATRIFQKHNFICKYRDELMLKAEAQQRKESSVQDSISLENKSKKL